MQRKDTVVEGDVLRGLNKEELRLLGLFFGLRECGGCAWHSKRNNQKDRPHDMHRCLLRSSFTPILAATVEALSRLFLERPTRFSGHFGHHQSAPAAPRTPWYR